MDLGSIFLILALLLLTGLFVARPFFDHKGTLVSKEERVHSSLLADRDRILAALQELDFDNSMGKIPEEDYPVQRALLLKRGADVLRQMEEEQGQKHAQRDQSRLKAAVAGAQPAAAAVGGARSGVRHEDDDLERLIASRRRDRSEKASGFCPQCGGPLQKSDQFCPKCGAGVKSKP
jgi:rubrerythrin